MSKPTLAKNITVDRRDGNVYIDGDTLGYWLHQDGPSAEAFEGFGHTVFLPVLTENYHSIQSIEADIMEIRALGSSERKAADDWWEVHRRQVWLDLGMDRPDYSIVGVIKRLNEAMRNIARAFNGGGAA